MHKFDTQAELDAMEHEVVNFVQKKNYPGLRHYLKRFIEVVREEHFSFCKTCSNCNKELKK